MTWVTEPQRIRSLYGRCSPRSTTTSLRPTAKRPRSCHINGGDKRPASCVAISGLILQQAVPNLRFDRPVGKLTSLYQATLISGDRDLQVLRLLEKMD